MPEKAGNKHKMTIQTAEKIDEIMTELRDFIDEKDMDAKAFDLLIHAQDSIRQAKRMLFPVQTSIKQATCSFCGHETWHCSHGGHCFSWREFHEWQNKFGKSKEMTAKVRKLISKFIPEQEAFK